MNPHELTHENPQIEIEVSMLYQKYMRLLTSGDTSHKEERNSIVEEWDDVL